jgi:hypothetical protein
MKKSLAALALLLPIAATAADFTGPSVWAGGQYINATSKGGISNQLGSINADMGNNGYGVSFGGDYGFSVNDDVKVLLGASWMDTAKAGKLEIQGNGSLVGTLESKPKYSVYIAPGYKINDSTLAYFKASFTKAKGRLTETETSQIPDGGGTSSVQNRYNVNDDETALGYGFGLRSYVTDQIFLNADVSRTNFKYTFDGSDVRTPVVRATVAVGMSF